MFLMAVVTIGSAAGLAANADVGDVASPPRADTEASQRAAKSLELRTQFFKLDVTETRDALNEFLATNNMKFQLTEPAGPNDRD